LPLFIEIISNSTLILCSYGDIYWLSEFIYSNTIPKITEFHLSSDTTSYNQSNPSYIPSPLRAQEPYTFHSLTPWISSAIFNSLASCYADKIEISSLLFNTSNGFPFISFEKMNFKSSLDSAIYVGSELSNK